MQEGKERKGRPPFEPTDAQRALVIERLAAGDHLAAVALAVGVSIPTLRKAFSSEIASSRGASSAPSLFDLPDAPVPTKPADRTTCRAPSGGRPQYEPRKSDREKVMTLVAAGFKVDAIARQVGVSEPTLRKHFVTEMERGLEVRLAEELENLRTASKRGNVAAARTLIEHYQKTDRKLAERSFTGEDETESNKSNRRTPAPGKKEQRLQDAVEAVAPGSTWGQLINQDDDAPVRTKLQ